MSVYMASGLLRQISAIFREILGFTYVAVAKQLLLRKGQGRKIDGIQIFFLAL